jgi:hypothetical protein
MTIDQREQELLRHLESLKHYPPAKPKAIDPDDIKHAARRGARKARKFLAENPSQDDMQVAWDLYEYEMHMLDDSLTGFAYHAAYLKTLERQVTVSPTSGSKDKNTQPILTIMDDYGTGSFLWLNWIGDDNVGAGARCCDAGYQYENTDYRCGLHPMSDQLFEALKEWIAMVADAPSTEGTLLNPDDPMLSDHLVKPAPILNWLNFHVRGLELAKRLKREVGIAFRVVYEKPKADPARQEGLRYEVLDDELVVPLPPRRLFRFIC